jgi:hypothetical protein
MLDSAAENPSDRKTTTVASTLPWMVILGLCRPRDERAYCVGERLMPPVMNEAADPPVRVVARKAHEYFTRHRAQVRETSLETLASVASAEAIETVIRAAFQASLRREETYIPRLSLAMLAPEEAVQPLIFEDALPLTPASLARLSPAVARSGLHVAVWNLGDELYAWGIIRSIPISCGVIEVAAPGLLVIKHRLSETSRKFRQFAAWM